MSFKHRKVAVRVILAAGIVVAFALVWSWPRGPVYQGKSVTEWFKLFQTAPLAEKEEARDAFKALGDQAVPFLLTAIDRSGGLSLRASYGRLWMRLPPPIRRLLPGASPDDTEQSAAHELLQAIGPSAKALLPRLRPWLVNPENPRYLLALHLLGTIDGGSSEGIPFLVQALQSTNRYHRRFAVDSLRFLAPEARVAVPGLIKALDDPMTHLRAIRVLGAIGPEAKAAIPELKRLLELASRSEALVVAAALHKINPDGNSLRLLIEAVKDPELSLLAIENLGEIGPSALPARGILLEALRSAGWWIGAADALRKISPTNRAAIAILVQRLEHTRGLDRKNIAAQIERSNIASELVRFDPAEPRGLNVLVETLRSAPDAGSRAFAAYLLRQAGPGARAAIPALKAALKDKDKSVQRAAASALRKIAAAGAP